MKAFCQLLLALAAIASFGTQVSYAGRVGHGVSICVDPSGANGCETTIQSAVNLAVSNAVIMVSAGTYSENVIINQQKGRKASKFILTINGAGAGSTIVDGGDAGSVFNVWPKTILTLSGLTIQNGKVGSNMAGGGVTSDLSAITIKNCVLSGNQADFGGGISIGGGSLSLTESTVSGNSASQGGGIWMSDVGGRLSVFRTELHHSIIDANAAKNLSRRQTSIISESTISGNQAVPDSVGDGGIGAGIDLYGGKLTILNTTISGNAAVDGTASTSIGGGIYRNTGRITLNNVTISGNSATIAGGISAQTFSRRKGAAGDVRGPTPRFFKIANSIIANNTASIGNDCDGELYSRGYNLVLDAAEECAIGGDTSTDITGEDPLLLPLANNGGATETQSLGAGSPALKAANPATPNGNGSHCLATDQMGNPRPKGACDIGAVQVSGIP